MLLCGSEERKLLLQSSISQMKLSASAQHFLFPLKKTWLQKQCTIQNKWTCDQNICMTIVCNKNRMMSAQQTAGIVYVSRTNQKCNMINLIIKKAYRCRVGRDYICNFTYTIKEIFDSQGKGVVWKLYLHLIDLARKRCHLETVKQVTAPTWPQ